MEAVFQIHAGSIQKVSKNCKRFVKKGQLIVSVTGQSNQKSLYIMCDDAEHCQDFHFSDIVLAGAVSISGLLDLQCL